MNTLRPSLENAVKRRFPVLAGFRKVPTAVVVGATLLATAGSANALTVADFSEAIALITGVVAIVSAFGIAVLSVVVTARLFGWIRSALR